MVLASADEPILAEQRECVAAFRAAARARAELATYAEAMERLLPRTVPLGESLRVAGQSDLDCRRVRDGLNQRRADNVLAHDLRATGEIREELTEEDVAHLVWMTNSAEYYRLATSGDAPPSSTPPRSSISGRACCWRDTRGQSRDIAAWKSRSRSR